MSQLRPMFMNDLVKVVNIIHSHDEDDGEAAEADYRSTGVEHQYIFEHDATPIGVTGFREIPSADQSYWLSWTYLDKAFIGKGLGKHMLQDLITLLRTRGARKLFVKVSNYEDPQLGNIYANALKTYQSLGFVEELINHDFYDDGEDQIILSFTFNPEAADESISIKDEKPVLEFVDLYEIAETDDAYSFAWNEQAKKTFFGKKNFTVVDLRIGIDAARAKGARKIFLTFPSNLPLIHQPLQAAGFVESGKIAHYYEQSVHELHFCYDLTAH